jgi:hypothetical protein
MTTLREVSRIFLRAGCAVLLIAAFALVANAQSNKGTITGTVTDPNGAVVKDAKVTVTNVANGESRDVTSSDDGTYSIPALDPGVTRPNLGLLGGGGNFVSGGGGQNNTESTRFRESGGSVMVVNGARATNNNFSLDGVDNNESQFGQIAIFPNPDAIAEFKIETSAPRLGRGRAVRRRPDEPCPQLRDAQLRRRRRRPDLPAALRRGHALLLRRAQSLLLLLLD